MAPIRCRRSQRKPKRTEFETILETTMDFAYLFTSLDGHINRKAYWLAALVLLVVSLVVQLPIWYAAGMQVTQIVGLIFFWPGFALAVKRAHDRNRPTWLVAAFIGLVLLSSLMQIAGLHETDPGEPTGIFLALTLLIGVFAIYGFIDWGLLKGTTGPNQYGPDPLQQG
jgi:uncharacterized membrane protein YhaH (DUF805 family)